MVKATNKYRDQKECKDTSDGYKSNHAVALICRTATITEWPPKWFLTFSAANRPLRCMVLFWLLFVLVLVLNRSCNCIIPSRVNALLRQEFGKG
jgi:hypothetical protein